MASVILNNASLAFPGLGAHSRGFLNTIFSFSRFPDAHLNKFALDSVNLSARDGDRIGIIGSNGSGKTTLLRLISGAYEPSKGDVITTGSVTALTDITIGMEPEASGHENIVNKLLLSRIRRSDHTSLIQHIESFSELGAHLEKPIRTYSQGMLLRLAFACATAHQSEIILMDEMIGVGDERFVKKAHDRLSSIMSNSAILFLASHNTNLLLNFCTSGIVLNEGKLVFTGDINEAINFHRRTIA